jgi:predicted alpha/beta-hydrolase family hydrolase
LTKLRLLRFQVSPSAGEVSALLALPAAAKFLLVLAHGAGADMNHPAMAALADALAERRIGTFRYQFPYAETGNRAPSPRRVLLDTVRSAVGAAAECAGGATLLAGGKSMGGRMTSLAATEATLPGVAGLVFFGFPLHPAGKPAVKRAEHLAGVELPMLFLQGTRDKLADLELLRPVCRGLGRRGALHVVDGADHSFHMLKRSGRSDQQVLAELAQAVETWAAGLQSQTGVRVG